jgi:gliding motility-associated-like protein
MIKNLSIIFTLIISITKINAQTIIWQEDFDPAPTTWTLNGSFGTNAADANFWTISDDEGGVAPGGCGVASNGNNTLHITNTLFGGGATYNAGGLCPLLFCVTTNTRASTPNISTIGVTSTITLNFNYIEEGDITNDDFYVAYSTNGGLSWTTISNPPKTLNAPCSPQGLWTAYSINLPATCNNISNLRIGFCWTNNDDGVGTDPSVAVNDVTLTIPSATNTAPVANIDSIAIPCNNGSNIILSPLVNDVDANAGQILNISNAIINPLQGSITYSGTNINYLPAAGFSGIAYIAYSICDNGSPILCDTSYVAINILNSTCNTAPIAANDTVATNCNTSITFSPLINDVDANAGQILSISAAQLLSAGSGSITNTTTGITYTPATGYSGSAAIGYIVCDNGVPSLCDTGFVYITISSTGCNTPPVAVTDNVSVICGTTNSILITANDYDPDFNAIAIAGIVGNGIGAHGTLTNTGFGYLNYAPIFCNPGVDTFRYIICDNGVPNLCDTGMVILNSPACGCNAAPIANPDTIITLCNAISTKNVKLNDTDPNIGDIINATGVITSGITGTVSLASNVITFTPTVGYVGTQTMQYIICDNASPSLCDTGIVVLISYGCNTAPIAANDNITIPCFGNNSINVLSNDVDTNAGTILSVTYIKNASYGTTTLANGVINYTHTICTLLADTIIYRVCDNGSPNLCDTALAIFNISGCNCNNPPNAVVDIANTACNTNLSLSPILNDTDPDAGQTLSLANILVGPYHGVATVSGNTINYTPALCYSGNDTIAYIVCDNYSPAKCDTGIIFITIGVCNCNPPVSNFIASKTTVCAGDCINFTDQSTNIPTSWVWGFPGSNTPTSTLQNPSNICYDVPGTYAVSLIASNIYGTGNTETKTNFITVVPDLADVVYNLTDTINRVISMNANVATGITSYNWVPSAGLSSTNTANTSFTLLGNTSYTCNIANINGCTGSVTFNYSGIQSVYGENLIWVPTAFSPNFDGVNDVLSIKSYNVKEYEINIFNRWGNLVFTSKNPNDVWIGNHKKAEQGIQNYMYVIKATFNNGEKTLLKGDITVLY